MAQRDAGGASWTTVVGRPAYARRLQVATELGADLVVTDDEALGVIRGATDGGADVVLEAAGSPDGVELAVDLAGVGATVALTGLPPETRASFEAIRVTRDEISVVGVEGNIITDRERALALMAQGRLRAGPMVTHRFAMDQAEEAFEIVAAGEACKAVFDITA